MQNGFNSSHFNDANGNPAGGLTEGTGFKIVWQNGPLGRGEDRIEPNGAFVEDIIAAAIDRIEYYQKSRFACRPNSDALESLKEALAYLEARTADREERKVEGTHEE